MQMTDKVEEVVEEKPVETEPLKREEPVVETAPDLPEGEVVAKSYGWMPKDEWVKAGNAEEDWTPAKHFMKFGELKQKMIQKDKELQKQAKLFVLMKTHHEKVKETAYKQALNDIKQERKAALEQENFAKAESLRDEMDALKERYEVERALPADIQQELASPVIQPQGLNPEFVSWHSKNQWYVSDPAKQDEASKMADVMGQAFVLDAQRRGVQPSVSEIYQKVEKEIKARYPDRFKTPKSPQSDGPTTRGAPSPKGSVKLSEEQLSVAKAFGLSPEKYAQQLDTYDKGKKW
jgi:hypothetical protein